MTVLESRPRLGGRASSFVDKATGTQIDNCQHVSLGCCTNFQHFCRTVGLADLFRTERALYFIGRDGAVNRLAAGALPAPLHLATAFARTSYLSVRDLLAIGRGMRALARGPRKHNAPSPDAHFAAWLVRHRQTQTAIDRFWTPVLVSSLSETLERVDVDSARKVFVDGFLANRQGWEVQIPTVPLDTLYGARLTSWLAERAASVRLQAGVAHLAIAEGRAAGVVLRSGETIPAEHVVIAVPHWLVLEFSADRNGCASGSRPRARTGDGADLERSPLVRSADPVSARSANGPRSPPAQSGRAAARRADRSAQPVDLQSRPAARRRRGECAARRSSNARGAARPQLPGDHQREPQHRRAQNVNRT